MKNEIEIGILMEYINNIIRQAIYHGGDSGGAYFTNREKLKSAMGELIWWLSLHDYVICEDYQGYMYYAKPIRDEKGGADMRGEE